MGHQIAIIRKYIVLEFESITTLEYKVQLPNQHFIDSSRIAVHESLQIVDLVDDSIHAVFDGNLIASAVLIVNIFREVLTCHLTPTQGCLKLSCFIIDRSIVVCPSLVVRKMPMSAH